MMSNFHQVRVAVIVVCLLLGLVDSVGAQTAITRQHFKTGSRLTHVNAVASPAYARSIADRIQVRGANQVWDFRIADRVAGPFSSDQAYERIPAPQADTLFPLANYRQILFSKVPDTEETDTTITYLHLSDTALVLVGNRVATRTTQGQPFRSIGGYINAVRYRFPFELNDMLDVSYSNVIYSQAGQPRDTTPSRWVRRYIGHGTLILPSGSFTNVALVHTLGIDPGFEYNNYGFLDLSDSLNLVAAYSSANAFNPDPSFSYTVNGPSSRKARNPTLAFELYPNPSSGRLQVKLDASSKLGEVQAEILDARGSSLRSLLIPADSETLMLNLDLPAGFYILRLQTPQGSGSRSFVIQ